MVLHDESFPFYHSYILVDVREERQSPDIHRDLHVVPSHIGFSPPETSWHGTSMF